MRRKSTCFRPGTTLTSDAVSQDTALRDIQDLIEWGALRRTAGGGRSTGYEISD